MAVVHLEAQYDEESHYTITVATSFTPNTMKYSVYDEDDNIINSLSSQAVASPSTSTLIELDGPDLAISDPAKTKRYVSVYGTYNGGTDNFASMVTFDGNKIKGK